MAHPLPLLLSGSAWPWQVLSVQSLPPSFLFQGRTHSGKSQIFWSASGRMTILNAIVSPEKVLLSADTLTRLQHSGKESKTTKIFLLPHLRAIIAGTGTNELAPALQMTLLNVPDFDTAEIMLRSAISELYSKIKNQDRVKIAERQGIFIAG